MIRHPTGAKAGLPTHDGSSFAPTLFPAFFPLNRGTEGVFIFLCHRKARTVGLAGIHVLVTHHPGLGIAGAELADEKGEGAALGGRAGVGGCMAVGGEAADVAHTDGMPVVAAAMGTGLLFGTGGLDGAVGGNHVVVAAAVPSVLGAMDAVDVGHAEGTARLVGRAVHDDVGDCSHCREGMIRI